MNKLIDCLPCNERQEMVTGCKANCHKGKALSGVTSDREMKNEVSTNVKQQKL